MPAHPKLTIRSIRARGVNVPMARPLQTGGGAVSTAPLVLVDLETEEGVTGSSYVFCYTALALKPTAQLVTNMESLIKGDLVAPIAIEQKLQKRFRLLGPQGLTGMAMAGIDMAAWDALAKAVELPLVKLLGGEPRPITAYNSNGLGIIGAERAAIEARELIAPGFKAIKVRLGYPDVKTDVAVIRAVRKAVGDDILLMTDYNQSLTVPEAILRCRLLDEEGIYWVEEPTVADDFLGHAAIARAAKTPIQIGENWWGTHDMAKSLAAEASDYVMIDVMKVGGVTGWLRGAALVEPRAIPASSHLFPEISAHLLAVTPTCHWMEYVDWASPILKHPLRLEKGQAQISVAPGVGLEWDEQAVQRFLVE